MGLRVWIWLLSLSVLWGGSFFFAKVAIGELGPLTVVFARVALAALALDIVLIAARTNPFRRDAPWPAYFAMGLLNNVLPFSLIFWGQTHIASGLASILNATTPLFTLLVAHFLTQDEKIDPAKVAALLAGFAGVAVLIGPEMLVDGASVWGELACLGAALSYAFAGVYGRRFKILKIAPIEAAAGQVTASTVLILPIMLAVEQPWTLPASPSLAGLGSIGWPGAAVDGAGLHPVFPHPGRRRRHHPAARHLPDTGHRRPAGRGRPGRAAGAAALRRNGPDWRRPRRHRRPHRTPATPREIAVWLHNCASGGGLLGCPRTRQSSRKSFPMAKSTATLTDNETGKSYEMPIIHGTIGPRLVDIRKFYGDSGMFTYDPGFTSTGSCASKITYIDGDEGVLLYRGYNIAELAEQSDFMECCYLLMKGELPNKAQKEKFVRDITNCTRWFTSSSASSIAASGATPIRWRCAAAWSARSRPSITTRSTSTIRTSA